MFKCILLAGFCLAMLFFPSCKKDNYVLAKPIDYRADGEVVQLLKSTAKGANTVNIVILGDGYQKGDLAKGGEFDLRAQEVTDFIFNTAPFGAYKQYFNVYQVCAESNDTGAGYGTPNVDTKFNSYFTSNPKSLVAKNITICNQYAKKAVPNGNVNILILLVNNTEYGASGSNIAVVATGDNYLGTVIHEIGHTFAGLGDEYISNTLTQSVNKDVLANFANLDATISPAKVKWSSYLQLKAYSTVVGVYEGGYFVSKGIYRPEYTSVMRDPGGFSNYNAPSREAVARRICNIAGVNFNLTDFLDKDKNAIQPKLNTTAYNQPITPLVNDFINPVERLAILQAQPNQ